MADPGRGGRPAVAPGEPTVRIHVRVSAGTLAALSAQAEAAAMELHPCLGAEGIQTAMGGYGHLCRLAQPQPQVGIERDHDAG